VCVALHTVLVYPSRDIIHRHHVRLLPTSDDKL